MSEAKFDHTLVSSSRSCVLGVWVCYVRPSPPCHHPELVLLFVSGGFCFCFGFFLPLLSSQRIVLKDKMRKHVREIFDFFGEKIHLLTFHPPSVLILLLCFVNLSLYLRTCIFRGIYRLHLLEETRLAPWLFVVNQVQVPKSPSPQAPSPKPQRCGVCRAKQPKL